MSEEEMDFRFLQNVNMRALALTMPIRSQKILGSRKLNK